MKIELKKIRHSPSLSEETEAFTANLYINNVHAGYAKNQGHGGNTDYSSKDDAGRQLIKDAEQYCRELPPRPSSFDPEQSYPVTLEDLIDDLLCKHLAEQHALKFNRKMEKLMLNGVVFGIPGQSYTAVTYKIPLTALLVKPNGAESLTNTIKSMLPELINGTVILNNNISEKLLKEAGVKEDQYLPMSGTQKQQQRRKAKRSNKP